jgi:hypothetical protein
LLELLDLIADDYGCGGRGLDVRLLSNLRLLVR